MALIDWFRFHFAFVGFTCRVVDNKILLGFWLRDKFIERQFDDWNSAVNFSRAVNKA